MLKGPTKKAAADDRCADLQPLAGGGLFSQRTAVVVRRGDKWLSRYAAAVGVFAPRDGALGGSRGRVGLHGSSLRHGLGHRSCLGGGRRRHAALGQLARQAGSSQSDVLGQLTQLLPQVVVRVPQQLLMVVAVPTH